MYTNLDMEHNHNPLIYGFLLSFLMFGLGMASGFFSMEATDWESRVVVQVIGGLMVVAGIIMLRGVFQTRDECPICKDKYQYGKKKNV